jgi:hypothetical protein
MKIGIVRFSTLVMKTGIVSASSVPITKTQRRVCASTSAMKTYKKNIEVFFLLLDRGKNIINFTELFVNTR